MFGPGFDDEPRHPHIARLEDENRSLHYRVAELERVTHDACGWARIALGILRDRPWPTPNAEAYLPLEKALAEIIAATQAEV